ncbi:aminoglycoside phosphotransferase [Lentzea sp. BCCO 10_0798]|uniref:Aminoglycoside phosphotransferase n=1 Tax=Lentzea kristufekii TaxID=3095430 RepID=A0ABU4TK18_9PSEU|nr:phosphotransferase [Lentzea sp. BCCO 10_0798]MDX8048593.1 aminoglycoside phosphotransferase [Lentzea sp. BCCO 10_0798]
MPEQPDRSPVLGHRGHTLSPQLSEADAQFREWMHENLDRAATHFNLTIIGEPSLGWLDRSISAPVRRIDEQMWLRVVSEDRQWIAGEFWTGNLEANAFTALSKPRVVDVFEWEHGRHQRAELMTLVPGSPCSRTDALRHTADLPDEWWAELRRTSKLIAAMPTDRVNADQALVTGRMQQQFGNSVNPVVREWETVHGDLHWANLMGPQFGLLDWESWGRGPVGTDAATLLSYSLLVPQTAERVRDTFADVLATDAGLLAQFYVAARLLHRVDRGDHPDLAAPLRRHVDGL